MFLSGLEQVSPCLNVGFESQSFWPQNPEKGLIFESSHFRGLVTFCTHLIFSAENICLNSKNFIILPTILALASFNFQ
jgi:hypothetical protein